MADDSLNVSIRADVSQLSAGMTQAASATQAAAAQITAAFGAAAAAAIALMKDLMKEGMTAEAAAGQMRAAGVSAQSTAVAFRNLASATVEAAAGAEAHAVALTGIDRAMATATGRVLGMSAGLGMAGGALGRVAAASAFLGPILSAAFPVILVGVFIDLLYKGLDAMHKWGMEAEMNAVAWQKIDHESTLAMDQAVKKSQQLEVQIAELTQGKLAAMALALTFVGDNAVEMGTRIVTMLDQTGKEIDKEVSKWDKLVRMMKEFSLGSIPGGKGVIATLGEQVDIFAAKLQKTLDTEGAAAGIHQVAEQIRALDAQIAANPTDPGLVHFRDELERTRALLTEGLHEEALTKLRDRGREAKEATTELTKSNKEKNALDERNARTILELVNYYQRLDDAQKKLADDQASFGAKETTKTLDQQIKATRELVVAENKAAADRLADAEKVAIGENEISRRLVEQQLALGRISAAQALAQLNVLTDQKLKVELDFLTKEQAVIGQRIATQQIADAKDLELWSKLQSDKVQAVIKANAEIKAEEDKVQKLVATAWNKLENSMNTAMDGVLRGVLQGTQNIGQAFERLAGDIVLTMIEAFAKMTIAQVVANATMGAVDKEHSLAAIMRSAWQAAAKVYAEVPFPLNIPAAAAVFSAVAAMGGNLPSAAGGMWQVPNDMIAMVHKNESILPAGIAGSLRETVSSGKSGGDVHLHVHAIDASGVQAWFEKNSDSLVTTLQRARREFKI
jgi:hypothetical protein